VTETPDRVADPNPGTPTTARMLKKKGRQHSRDTNNGGTTTSVETLGREGMSTTSGP